MAAISEEIYIVGVAVKSGALITVDWGIELGRKIYGGAGTGNQPGVRGDQ